jgi:hypothetical protein
MARNDNLTTYTPIDDRDPASVRALILARRSDPRGCYELTTRMPNLCGLRRISALLPLALMKSGF